MRRTQKDHPSLLPVFRLRAVPIRGCPQPAGGYAIVWIIRLRGRNGVPYYLPTRTPVHEPLDCVVVHRTDSVDLDAGYMTPDGPVTVSPVPFSALGLTLDKQIAYYSKSGPVYPVVSPDGHEYTTFPTIRMTYENSATGRDPITTPPDA
jgi:hypothetical protein